MPRTQPRRIASVSGALVLVGLILGAIENPARAEVPPTAAIAAPAQGRHPFPTRGEMERRGGGLSGSWWLGTAGIVLALALFGGISLASRRLMPDRDLGGLKVVGRTHLTSKHMIHLVRTGDRVLIIGTGSQGAPVLLGEWDDPRPAAPGSDRRAGGDAS